MGMVLRCDAWLYGTKFCTVFCGPHYMSGVRWRVTEKLWLEALSVAVRITQIPSSRPATIWPTVVPHAFALSPLSMVSQAFTLNPTVPAFSEFIAHVSKHCALMCRSGVPWQELEHSRPIILVARTHHLIRRNISSFGPRWGFDLTFTVCWIQDLFPGFSLD